MSAGAGRGPDDRELTSGDFLRLLPKVDLHCHFTGAVAAGTVIDLARKNGVELARSDPASLYDVEEQTTAETRERRFFELLDLVATVLVDREDFARAGYELLERLAAPHNVRYMEVFVNPTAFVGVDYPTVVDGIAEGFAAAEEEFGVRANLIPSILREQGPDVACDLVETVIANPRDRVVGIGMDGREETDEDRASNFAEAYRKAGAAGLRRTAHATLAPPEEIEVCLDLLGCERIDHGYRVLDSPALAERIREQGTPITVCETITRVVFGISDPRWRDISTHPARRMLEAGLPLTIGTDDPEAIPSSATLEYQALLGGSLFDPDQAAAVALEGVAASWLEQDERDALAASFAEEIAALRARLESFGAPQP